MMYQNLLLASLTVIVLSACSARGTGEDSAPLSLQWEITASPAPGTSETLSRLAITNNTSDTLNANGWSIYFNAGAARVADADTSVASIELINGDFFRFYPGEDWQPLVPGATVEINVMSRMLRNFTDIPKGFYLVSADHPEGVSLPVHVKPFAQADSLEMVLAAQVYEQNTRIADVSLAQLPPVLPTPVSYEYNADSFMLSADGTTINADSAFTDEAAYLQDELAKV